MLCFSVINATMKGLADFVRLIFRRPYPDPWPKEKIMPDYPSFVIDIEGKPYTFTPVCRQEYSNCYFEAGLIEDHPIEKVFLRLSYQGETPLTIYLRPDEMQALAWVMNGALWSLTMQSVKAEG